MMDALGGNVTTATPCGPADPNKHDPVLHNSSHKQKYITGKSNFKIILFINNAKLYFRFQKRFSECDPFIW